MNEERERRCMEVILTGTWRSCLCLAEHHTENTSARRQSSGERDRGGGEGKREEEKMVVFLSL